MPRLQILHHKSYHPYNEKNKQRVREDEAKARAEELALEQRAIDAESEARLHLLRRRAGSPEVGPSQSSSHANAHSGDASSRFDKTKSKEDARERRAREGLDFDFPSETKKRKDRQVGLNEPPSEDHSELEHEREHSRSLEDRFQSGGHMNFWADLEKGQTVPAQPPTPAELAKRKAEQEADKYTMYLSRPARETKPWYTDRELKRVEDKEAGDEAEYRRARDRRRDVRAKDRNDPLTDMKKSLAAAQRPASRGSRTFRGAGSGPGSTSGSSGHGQSERERALALLAKKSGTTSSGTGSRGWESPAGRGSWHDELERQKDTAGNRYHADTWDRSRSGRR